LRRLAIKTRARPGTGRTHQDADDVIGTPALPWGNRSVTDFLGRCDEASAGDFAIRYLSRPDLIQMRQASGRVKDLRRASELMNGVDVPGIPAVIRGSGVTGGSCPWSPAAGAM
jgi:hypothetical protein